MSQINLSNFPSERDTIAAESTPQGRGGISLIRVSGKDSISITSVLNPRISKQKPRLSVLRKLYYEGEWLDEALVTIYLAPSSYTGENLVEIASHGNPLIVRKILNALYKSGARPAEPGEFTRRAYLNGRLSLSRAEAIAQLINAENEAALRVAKNLYSGGLEKKLQQIRTTLLELLVLVEASIDFIDEGIHLAEQQHLICLVNTAEDQIKKLLSAVVQGKISQTGILVVLAGLPNVGKSSLFNALCLRQRAIVAPTPGTTRDTIEITVEWEGLLIRLIDTAGIRETSDPVEAEGVLRTRQAIQMADVVLWVLDVTESPQPKLVQEILSCPSERTVLVCNKSDLVEPDQLSEFCRTISESTGYSLTKTIVVSAIRNHGLDELRKTIIKTITSNESLAADALNIHEKHQHLLEVAAERLVEVRKAILKGCGLELAAIDIREALAHIGSITSPVSNEELLDSIFSRFCIGK